MKRATVEKGITSYDAQISIHALVKRATGNAPAVQATPLISIHALVKRATIVKAIHVVQANIFQSTPS